MKDTQMKGTQKGTQMKALVKKFKQPGLVLADVPIPEIGPRDVLVKVLKTAICGTDLHIYQWDEWAQKTIPVPLTIGHEFMGVVEAIGSDVNLIPIGARVSGEGHMTCGFCRNCRAGRRHLCRNTLGLGVTRTGCFAEYVSIPADNIYLIPDNISDDVAAFLDPLGNAVHTALSFDLVGEDVLITGAGPIGIMAVAICRHAGARHIVITDVNDYRLNLAKQMGASRVVNVGNETLESVMRDLGMQEGFDVGLEMSGQSIALNLLLEQMNNGGHIALLGIPSQPMTVDLNKIIFKGLVLKGIYGREMFETWYKMVSMLSSGLSVSLLVTDQFSYADFELAFAKMKTGLCGKIILNWG